MPSGFFDQKNSYHLAFKLGAWSCVQLILYTLLTIIIVTFFGGPSQSVSECFLMLRENRLIGFLRLDILTVFLMPLYYVLFYSIFIALKNINFTLVVLNPLYLFVQVLLFSYQHPLYFLMLD